MPTATRDFGKTPQSPSAVKLICCLLTLNSPDVTSLWTSRYPPVCPRSLCRWSRTWVAKSVLCQQPRSRAAPQSGAVHRIHRATAVYAGCTRRTKGSSFRLLLEEQASSIQRGETKHLSKGVGKGERGNQTSRSQSSRLPSQPNDSAPDLFEDLLWSRPVANC